ncbi:MAG: oligosaccharide flippase family protein [Lentisphaerota bacterium]
MRLNILKSPTLKRILNGSFWNFVATLFTQGATFSTNIILARILGKEIFGEYAGVYNCLLIMSSIAQLAIGYTATKYIAEFRNCDKEKTGRIIGLCFFTSLYSALAGGIILFCMSGIIATVFFKAPNLTAFLQYGSCFVFFSVLNGLFSGILCGLEKFKKLASGSITSAVLQILLFSVGTAVWGMTGAVISLTLSGLLRLVIFFVISCNSLKAEHIKPVFTGYRKEKSIITRFALPAAMAGLFSMPVIFMTNTILIRTQDGFKEMASYAAANSLKQLVLFLPLIINSVGLSILNNTKGEKNNSAYFKVYHANIAFIVISAICGTLFVGIPGKYILWIFGKSFISDTGVLWILLLSIIPESLSIGMYQHMQSQEKLWSSLLFINLPREGVFLVLSFILIPVYKAQGLAIAYCISWMLCAVIIYIFVQYHQKEKNPKIWRE